MSYFTFTPPPPSSGPASFLLAHGETVSQQLLTSSSSINPIVPETIDPFDVWPLVTANVTIPEDAIYTVSATVSLTAMVTPTSGFVRVRTRKGIADIQSRSFQFNQGNGNRFDFNLSKCLQLLNGDNISLFVENFLDQDVIMGGADRMTSFTVERLGH